MGRKFTQSELKLLDCFKSAIPSKGGNNLESILLVFSNLKTVSNSLNFKYNSLVQYIDSRNIPYWGLFNIRFLDSDKGYFISLPYLFLCYRKSAKFRRKKEIVWLNRSPFPEFPEKLRFKSIFPLLLALSLLPVSSKYLGKWTLNGYSLLS